MEALLHFYNSQIASFSEKKEALKKQIHRLGTVRLLLFVCALVSVWVCRDFNWLVLTGIVFVFAVPFTVLMVYHTKLFYQKEYAEAMCQLNTNEIKGIEYDFSAFDGAAESIEPNHSFAPDLDLFGNQSMFQSINRTVTQSGKACLINWFTMPLDNKQEIISRQKAVQELAAKTHFRQHFFVTGIMGISRQSSENGNFIKNSEFLRTQGLTDERSVRGESSVGYGEQLNALTFQATHFSQSHFWKISIWIVPVIWTGVILGCIAGVFSLNVLGIMFAFAFLIANFETRKIKKLSDSAEKIERHLLTCSQLIKQIEQESFNSEMLKANQSLLNTNGKPASEIIRKLSKIIGALDQRYSLIGIILNLLYLRDMRHAMQLEWWTGTYAASFDSWFKALAQIDAISSMGGFSFNHPDYVYPVIAGNYFEMKGIALGHPLIHRDVCVRNDLQIEQNPFFLVITGANMAGKSTYLRTVGINFLLSCMGLPVYAESLTVYPAHLVTSLRTTDSLTAHESYFFAELKRLKMIIDRLNAGEQLFIILDEILKGTNSEDKQKGSLALMKQLISKNTCGIIATHDLLLGSLAQEFPDEIRNYRFEADISGDELTFSYRLKEGIAQNMNACFLMGKMGITIGN